VAPVAVVFFAIIPLSLHEYYLSVANLVFVAVIGAIGLNILVGYTGQVSIGHGAFMSVGAYTAANLAVKLGLPFWITLPAGGGMIAAKILMAPAASMTHCQSSHREERDS
jgi:branched-chain amino acid transport system permease protein